MSEGLLAQLERLNEQHLRRMAYTKPARAPEQSNLLSNALDNKLGDE